MPSQPAAKPAMHIRKRVKRVTRGVLQPTGAFCSDYVPLSVLHTLSRYSHAAR